MEHTDECLAGGYCDCALKLAHENNTDGSKSPVMADYAAGTLVRVEDTPSEMYRPNTAKVLSGPDSSNFYWIEMSTGVQWSCPGYRLTQKA